jgi:isochorismate synthase
VTAVTPLAPAFDLLAAYEPGGVVVERDGLGVATGAAGTWVEPPDVAGALGDGGGVACGALPFGGGGRLLVADRVVRRGEDGTTMLGPARTFTRVAGRGTPAEPFTDVQRRDTPTPEGYARAVEHAVAAIRSGAVSKVVLARTLEVSAGRPLDPVTLVHRLRAVNPDAWAFAAPVDAGTLVGASPELLVSRHGDVVRSNPLAGTAPRSGDPERDRAAAEALLGSAKDREEHAIVVEAVAEVLAERCDDLRWDPEPVVQATPNVWHLSTRFEGRLDDPSVSALDVALALHPTPAVAGSPTAAALALIDDLEPFDRGAYAGPVGWVDASGDGEFAIALRCALLHGDRATLYAGAGIVRESDPSAELDETERKFLAFLEALRWG